MKLTTSKINELFDVDDSWQAPDALMKILFDRERREKMFREFESIEIPHHVAESVAYKYRVNGDKQFARAHI